MNLPGVSLHTYVIFRCDRWGTYMRWLNKVSLGQLKPQYVKSWWGPMILDRNVERIAIVREPGPEGVDEREAIETGTCVIALEEDLRDALIEVHVNRGTWQQQCQALGGIDRTTLWRRKERAYAELLGLFNDVAAGLSVLKL